MKEWRYKNYEKVQNNTKVITSLIDRPNSESAFPSVLSFRSQVRDGGVPGSITT